MKKHFPPLQRLLFSLCLMLGSLGGGARAVDAPAPYWPDQHWRSATPESQGIDSGKLAEVFRQVQARHSPIHGLLVIRHGYVVLDAHFFPYDGIDPHDIASATKSVTATLIGIAIDQGKLRGLDQSLLSVFSDRTVDGHGGKAQVSIGDLLAMRSGLACENGRDEVAQTAMRAGPDWIQTMLDRPMAAPAGTHFTYCSGGMHLLSGAISRVSGMPALAFAQQNLFAPLGIVPGAWPIDPAGNNFGWGDLHLRPEDMAKIGYLYLHKGHWNGHRILSEQWVAEATRARTRVGDNEDYGLGWWLHPAIAGGLIEASGRGGQRILVLPAQDMVMVVTGGGLNLDDIGKPLLDAIGTAGPLPENLPRQKLLASLANAAAQAPEPPPAVTTSRLPATARKISGKQFLLSPNPLGIVALTLTFSTSAQAGMATTYVDGSHANFVIGLGATPIVSATGRFGLRAAAQGRWTSASNFALDLDEISNINAWHIDMTFVDGALQATARERSGTHAVALRSVGDAAP